jgi:hypothetical protein
MKVLFVLLQKICLFITKHLELSSIEEKQIAESCFDWIIDVNKKASYAIRALYELGKSTIGLILN